MLTEKRMIGESLIFNGKTKVSIASINEKCVTFKTILENGKHEICQGLLDSIVTLAGKIKVKITDIHDNAVSLQIEPGQQLVISRLRSEQFSSK